MSERFEIHAANNVTATHIANKYTLIGALNFASELLDTWDDVHVRHYPDETDTMYLMVAKLSNKGLII